MHVNSNSVTYFDGFGAEQIPKETAKFIGNKNIPYNFRVHTYDWIMCGYFCTRFINFMFKGKSMTDFIKLFSPHNF